VTGEWFSPGTLVSSTNKTDRHDTAEIMLKVALNTINPSIFVIHPTIFLFFDKRGYGDKKRGFWDKRGFGNRREIYDKRMGRFYPYMFLPNNS
jgi:hypothetical protein